MVQLINSEVASLFEATIETDLEITTLGYMGFLSKVNLIGANNMFATGSQYLQAKKETIAEVTPTLETEIPVEVVPDLVAEIPVEIVEAVEEPVVKQSKRAVIAATVTAENEPAAAVMQNAETAQ